MPPVREHVPLSGFTTLGWVARPGGSWGAPMQRSSPRSAPRTSRGEPVLVLGGGSNLVVADEGFAGTWSGSLPGGSSGNQPDGPAGHRRGGRGLGRPGRACGQDGLAGVECLSGIPGLAGATPIQNVGAYGQDVAETITAVRAYDRGPASVIELAAPTAGSATGPARSSGTAAARPSSSR